jgi:DDE superfamily endonuclease
MVGVQGHGNHAEGAFAAADGGGAARVTGARESEQRASRSGAASDGVVGRGWGRDVRGGGPSGRVSESASGHLPGAAVQSGGAGGAGDRGRAGTAADLRRGGAGADRGDGAAATRSEGGWDGDLVVEHLGADGASGGAPARGRDDDPAGATRRGQLVSADADVVPDRHRAAEAQGRGGPGGRSADRRKKGLIDLAYRLAEAAGIPVWCQDEAGPYQAIPQPGATWAPVGKPALQPHEYVRGGTAKLLTLFRPATGEVRAKGVTQATNAVLHPWLQAEVTAVLASLPPVTIPEEGRPPLARWTTWLGHEPREPLPPLRLLLIWDNLAGHLSWPIVRWLFQHGIMPLYTPLSGSWLNLAESVQRIIGRRALDGHHPQSQDELIAWLDDTVAGWNADPTPFTWHGKRYERRQRARQRRLGGSSAAQTNPHSIAA